MLACSLLLMALTTPLVVVLSIECLSAILNQRNTKSQRLDNGLGVSICVLIPAHNEQHHIQSLIARLSDNLHPNDSIIVIADNCEDSTAEEARRFGVTVFERQNSELRGKGHALAFGLEKLSASPPQVVVVIDADCIMSRRDIYKISILAHSNNRPVQALYLMDTPPETSPQQYISALAYLIKNHVRALGLLKLNQPCHLTGTGMAIPWELLSKIKIDSNNLVEDMQMGIDFAVAGHPPLFCPEAHVSSSFPEQTEAARTQKTRWEHGHLTMLLSQVPRLLKESIIQKRPELATLALDLAVPPLSLLVIAWILGWIFSLITWATTSFTIPLIFFTCEGLILLSILYLSWHNFGRQRLPNIAYTKILLYIFWKMPIYFQFIFNRQKTWIRTGRDHEQYPK